MRLQTMFAAALFTPKRGIRQTGESVLFKGDIS